jgi:hypothetical protein
MDEISSDVLGRIVLFNEKSRHMGGAGVSRGFWWGNLIESHHLEDQGVDGRKIQGVPKLVIQN